MSLSPCCDASRSATDTGGRSLRCGVRLRPDRKRAMSLVLGSPAVVAAPSLGLAEASPGQQVHPQARIVGGKEISPAFRYPFLAALLKQNEQVCGGTLVGPSSFLTAAHCFEEDAVEKASAGTLNLANLRVGHRRVADGDNFHDWQLLGDALPPSSDHRAHYVWPRMPLSEGRPLYIITQFVAGVCDAYIYAGVHHGNTFALEPAERHNWAQERIGEFVCTCALRLMALSVAET